jgi:uncharacterized protein (TIGR02246 family)
MRRCGFFLVGLAVLLAAIYGLRSTEGRPDEKPPADTPPPDIKPLTSAFLKAFNANDAAAIATLWTPEAEMLTAAGDRVRGSKAIGEAYAALFKSKPKIRGEVLQGEVRSLAPTVAIAEGVLKLTVPGDPEPDVTLFSALCIKEGDSWKFASVQAFEADPEPVKLADLEWLVGEWAGKGEGGELHATYAWEEGKKFLRCRYKMTTTEGKVMAGSQMIGAIGEEGVHGWLFDDTGAVGESTWEKDAARWVITSAGTLPDGTETTSRSILIPLGKDSLTWQSVDRTSDGKPEPDGKPIKMKRVPGK